MNTLTTGLLVSLIACSTGCGNLDDAQALTANGSELAEHRQEVNAPTIQAGPYYYAMPWDNGKRLTVCANSLTVYGNNGGTCTLTYPQTFTVYSGGSEWVSGHAWGYCNMDGWVQTGWFCWP